MIVNAPKTAKILDFRDKRSFKSADQSFTKYQNRRYLPKSPKFHFLYQKTNSFPWKLLFLLVRVVAWPHGSIRVDFCFPLSFRVTNELFSDAVRFKSLASGLTSDPWFKNSEDEDFSQLILILKCRHHFLQSLEQIDTVILFRRG